MTDSQRDAPSTGLSPELEQQFSELYKVHLRDVYNFAYYKIGNHHDAEDLTEQTFLQAYRHFARAVEESNGRPMRPWLIRIVQNLAANYHRDRSRRQTANISDFELASVKGRTEDVAAQREEFARIVQLIDHLDGERREALVMRFTLGMDNKEIAHTLGKSVGATKVLIHRAIKELQQEMDNYGS